MLLPPDERPDERLDDRPAEREDEADRDDLPEDVLGWVRELVLGTERLLDVVTVELRPVGGRVETVEPRLPTTGLLRPQGLEACEERLERRDPKLVRVDEGGTARVEVTGADVRGERKEESLPTVVGTDGALRMIGAERTKVPELGIRMTPDVAPEEDERRATATFGTLLRTMGRTLGPVRTMVPVPRLRELTETVRGETLRTVGRQDLPVPLEGGVAAGVPSDRLIPPPGVV